ncbi:hypothetical protein OUZ56_003956 [Daphnia magna]|uniref:Uncharacterized protein n=1 Tax=Daphnia magna TaxID=35525 RepID=A0ABQ9YNB9_9CRUS|nr:hypothetical protein OUZ56_003956 [Daphnia magna]
MHVRYIIRRLVNPRLEHGMHLHIRRVRLTNASPGGFISAWNIIQQRHMGRTTGSSSSSKWNGLLTLSYSAGGF